MHGEFRAESRSLHPHAMVSTPYSSAQDLKSHDKLMEDLLCMVEVILRGPNDLVWGSGCSHQNPAKPCLTDLAEAKQAVKYVAKARLHTHQHSSCLIFVFAHPSKSQWPCQCALPTLLPPAVWPAHQGKISAVDASFMSSIGAILLACSWYEQASQQILVGLSAGLRPLCARHRRLNSARLLLLPQLPPPCWLG